MMLKKTLGARAAVQSQFSDFCNRRIRLEGLFLIRLLKCRVLLLFLSKFLRDHYLGQSIQEWTSKICGRQPLKTLKGYGLLKQMLCYLQFRFKQYFCEEEHQLTTSSFLFFLKKNRPKKRKKISSIRYLIMLLINMRPVIFLVFSQYGLACKYGIIFQISTYNWMQNCIF